MISFDFVDPQGVVCAPARACVCKIVSRILWRAAMHPSWPNSDSSSRSKPILRCRTAGSKLNWRAGQLPALHGRLGPSHLSDSRGTKADGRAALACG